MRLNKAVFGSFVDFLRDADHDSSTNRIHHDAGTLTFIIGRQHLLLSG